MFKSVMVPVDGSEHAHKALEVACQLIKDSDTTLHILHIPEALAHETTLIWGIGAVTLETTSSELEKYGRELIDRTSREASALGAKHIDTTLAQGEPSRTILEQAKRLGVDAIIMGSRGLGDFSSLVVGGVSHKVSHSANCTVITVH
ncbi:Nucleotide-binding universal stress protein, UspA family [Onishia taeanensis]|jgi:nucleotide-binding universal stress UspA family protein|uniref:Nucleotide-binding universal stress protein, UspA family n=1 Tax=Onishia taeanensis TaxID=284577 RepID=A0A1G7T2E5_9GAMM|nr:universal stress protein [Halomonas taeanensis]MAX33138.1 universal stress protein [Halomonadaceae bacterium]SDG28829.1 Nucleotide-binding universal stress protein, UspA family [Halomonas taeanensis]